METMENNLPSATHQEKAKKMKKLRRWPFRSGYYCLGSD